MSNRRVPPPGRRSPAVSPAASEAPETLDAVGPRAPLVVVLGAEGKGLRQRTRECCDVLVRIDATGAIRSLNVSNAAAITLYALTRPVV